MGYTAGLPATRRYPMMKRFLLWLSLITLAVALLLPFALGRLLADAYPSLVQQVLNRPGQPVRLEQLRFRAGWFSSQARWQMAVAGQRVELNDRIRHFPLSPPAVLDGRLRVQDLPIALDYRLGLDRLIRLQGRLEPGQQGLALWQEGRLEAMLDPQLHRAQMEARMALLLLPALQLHNLHLAAEGQAEHWRIAGAADTLAHGPWQWHRPNLGLEQKPGHLTLELAADRLQMHHHRCDNLQLSARLTPANPGLWLKLVPLTRPMHQLDWLKLATALPEWLAAEPLLDVPLIQLRCNDQPQWRAGLRLQLVGMPPDGILDANRWLDRLQGEGWVETTAEQLQAWGLPAPLAETGRVDFTLRDGRLFSQGQSLPLQLLLPDRLPR